MFLIVSQSYCLPFYPIPLQTLLLLHLLICHHKIAPASQIENLLWWKCEMLQTWRSQKGLRARKGQGKLGRKNLLIIKAPPVAKNGCNSRHENFHIYTYYYLCYISHRHRPHLYRIYFVFQYFSNHFLIRWKLFCACVKKCTYFRLVWIPFTQFSYYYLFPFHVLWMTYQYFE